MEVALECNYQVPFPASALHRSNLAKNAVDLLKFRRRKDRPITVAARLPNKDTGTHLGISSLVGMGGWLRLLGHSDDIVDGLNIIHIAGTKDKGSTCAFTRSFLRTHGARTGFPRKIGLYASPDLRHIRERIQINDRPISEEQFTQNFFEVYDRLMDPYLSKEESPAQPRYLQFLALLAFHTFIREGVDAAIFETHSGGEYDVTNVVRKPVVTGITSLGLDHVIQLGRTLDSIVWHKAGIFKKGTPAFSVPQDSIPAEVLCERAMERDTTVTFVPINESLPMNARNLSVPIQRVNCSLALELARTSIHVKTPNQTLDTSKIIRGIDDFHWMGRFEIIQDGLITWFLDAAYNTMSLTQAAKWFATNTYIADSRKFCILIFSHYSTVRDGASLIQDLTNALSKHNTIPDRIIITTDQPREDGTTRIGKLPPIPFSQLYSDHTSRWKRLSRDTDTLVLGEPTVEGAIRLAREIGCQRCGSGSGSGSGSGARVLVTGSIHLVGGGA
ncbi:folylpolyglutamate synthase [Aspergillus sclerotiicarbonarius CBS 121057]|uniref:tetrahydrofolate synthase n=1 Tax=Aspergillus sclerotiicarbonarius (strain CBS 121057 / IBT 28362) TaxID=1448318 RepID=A0A319E615_ASPSB|nr:folylpolyglutamate synthase [Aspergillus sclerotiicarbonarius CBS 121057]